MITFTIALHGKHAWECWWKIVTATTASAMGGPLIIRATGKMPSRPLAKGERGRAFKAISLECCHHWALSSAYLSRSLGGSYMGTRSAQGTFGANLPL